MGSHHLCVDADINVWCAVDLLDEIVGHACRKSIPTYEDRHLLRVLRQIDRRLSSGVPCPSYEDPSLAHSRRLRRRSAVVDAFPQQRLYLWNAHAPIRGASRNHHSTSGDLTSV